MDAFLRRHPVWGALLITLAWLVLLAVSMCIASSVLHRPYGDTVSGTVARLAVTVCLVAVLLRLGWLVQSGVARLGRGQVWLLAVAGMVAFAGANLFAFYGRVASDLPSLVRRTDFGSTVASALAVGLTEELLFRGAVLFVLTRSWGATARGILGSVALTAVLFAILHVTQALTGDVPLRAVLLLTLETFVISIWWGALVVLSRSIWPAVVAHGVVNAIVAAQGLLTPVAVPEAVAYGRLLLFSLPLGLVGAWLLVRRGGLQVDL